VIEFSISPALSDRLVSSVHREAKRLFDEDYLRALRERRADAENYLISYFSRPIKLKLRARLRSPELIEDVSQETFLRVLTHFRSGKTLKDPGSLPGFVHGVCNIVALEFLRKHTRQDQIPESVQEPADSRLSPESRMVTEERKELVRRVLSELSEKDRQLLKRVFLEEEDKNSVCDQLHVDRGYLRVLLFRARRRFKVVLDRGNARGAGGEV
jgi:RNA polymerase sigma-70 factor (ECF subfamily)